MAMLIWSILAVPSAAGGAEAPNGLWELMVWGTILTGAVLALGIGVVLARRKYLESRALDSKREGAGFAMDKIESLHEGGQISDEEFRILRNVALGLDNGVEKKDNSALSEMSASDDENDDKGEEDFCADADKEQE